ncbi:protocadherin gamma-C5-like isoform 2-T2 [Discoglossus pictus]
MGIQNSSKLWKWQVVCLLFLDITTRTFAQLRYSVVEESDPGTFVGNVAKDLDIQNAAISHRRMRFGSAGSRLYFDVNQQSGALTTAEKIDRESVCGSSSNCLLPLELVLENPLELQHLVIEILDINDHSPIFSTTEYILRIPEAQAFHGSRFPLEYATDLDVGNNGVRQYKLNQHQYFSLSLITQKDGTLLPELVLERTLDREEQGEHQLILTAIDGGVPPRSGSQYITIVIVDSNDNPPKFDQSLYKANILENIPVNTVFIQLNATDLDEGLNAEIEYYFDSRTSDAIRQMFSIDANTGAISTNGFRDSEVSNFYEITVRAKDKGIPQLEGYCQIQIEIIDVNDHSPEILVTSLFSEIPEGTTIGTTIGLFNVRDKDSGKNGEVALSLSSNLPFKIKSFNDHYTLITDGILDREKISWYDITLIATDMGSPSLSTQRQITLNISDVNDNTPLFTNPNRNSYVQENNVSGYLLYTLSAVDPDEGKNAELTYSIAENHIYGSPVSSFVYINPKTGNIYAQRPFDYEQIQVLEITVRVEDSGTPRLFSNTTIFIFILDTNDNFPTVFYPTLSEELIGQQKVSRTTSTGHLVTKVSAVDLDSGRNAWLRYNFVEATDSSLFRLSAHTGEIRTLRNFLETDDSVQRLVISISDHGEPSLSTTVTILLTLEDNVEPETPKFHDFLSGSKNKADITMYLIICLVAISVVSLVTFLILLAKCVRKDSIFGHIGCCSLNKSDPKHYTEAHSRTLHLNMDGTLKYMEVRMEPSEPHGQNYKTYCSRTLENNDLNFLKPLNFPELKELVNGTDTMLSNVANSTKPNKAQPNTDWRFSQAQRPGTSGAAQPTEEAGVWPNNQFETERLQAMILASANEAAEGTSALGGGNGTMGLSARYGPQFTLQHVPDYRQNIYIPGTTSTLTNAAGKRDGKAAAPSGNKKKSGKKEKK